MVEAAVVAYFLVIAFGVVLVVFPGYRARVVAVMAGTLGASASPFLTFGRAVVAVLRTTRNIFLSAFRSGIDFVRRKPLIAGVALLTLGAPTLIALVAGGNSIFDYSNDVRVSDPQIVALLEGEQLAPPPALPPEVFTTREVEQVRPDVVHASRNWGQLDAGFTQRLLIVFKLMKEHHGYDMVLLEGYRSPERQARLAAMGSHVTNAGPNMSYHQYGLAADSAFMRDGKVVISERDPWAMRGYQLYGEVAEQVGLVWGGRWKMQDYGHVELRRAGVLARAAK